MLQTKGRKPYHISIIPAEGELSYIFRNFRESSRNSTPGAPSETSPGLAQPAPTDQRRHAGGMMRAATASRYFSAGNLQAWQRDSDLCTSERLSEWYIDFRADVKSGQLLESHAMAKFYCQM